MSAPDTSPDEEQRAWWITTDMLARGGTKVLGPFVTQELAIDVRALYEIVHHRNNLWVDDEATS